MKKTVTISLDRMALVVEGANEKELLENAKKELIKQLGIKFPNFTYNINDADALSLEDAFPGTIVENAQGQKGIITYVNPSRKRPLNVTFAGGITYEMIPQGLKLSNATFEEARYIRPSMNVNIMRTPGELMNGAKEHTTVNIWYEGDSAYLKNKGEIFELVIGKTTRTKYPAYIVNGCGRSFSLTENQLHLLKKTKEEVE